MTWRISLFYPANIRLVNIIRAQAPESKKPVIIFFCFILEILHLLLIWSVYDGIQRIRSPRGPELDGRKFSQQEQDAHA